MSQNLHLAQAIAWNLANTLMTCVTLFRSEAGYGVVQSCEYDGDANAVLYEYDPYA